MKKKREEIPHTLIGLFYTIIFYRTKEFFGVLLILFFAWIATLMINPEIAMAIKGWIIGKIK